MLFNNYKQALSIIDVEGSAVNETIHALGIELSDLEVWHHQQIEFFETLGEESPWDIHLSFFKILNPPRKHVSIILNSGPL